MSGRSCGSGRSAGDSLRLGPSPHHELVLDALYDRKRDNKSVRVLTVIVYVFCVSLAAIMLSLYYVFFWEPKDAHYAQRKVAHTVDQQTSTTPMPTCFMPYTGGSNTSMSANLTDLQIEGFARNQTSNFDSEEVVDLTPTETLPEDTSTPNVETTLTGNTYETNPTVQGVT